MENDRMKKWIKERREGIEIYYKGVNITDRVGLCVCNYCTSHIKNEIDNELKMSSVWWKKFLCKFGRNTRRNTRVFRIML